MRDLETVPWLVVDLEEVQSWDPGRHVGENTGAVLQYVSYYLVAVVLTLTEVIVKSPSYDGIDFGNFSEYPGRFIIQGSARLDEVLRRRGYFVVTSGGSRVRTYPSRFTMTRRSLASDLFPLEVLCKLVSRLTGGRARRVAAAQGPPNRHRSKTPQEMLAGYQGLQGPSALNCNWQTSLHMPAPACINHSRALCYRLTMTSHPHMADLDSFSPRADLPHTTPHCTSTHILSPGMCSTPPDTAS